MANSNAKKGVQNQEDALNKKEAFLLKNKKPILYGVLAVLVIIAGVILYKNFYSAPREAEASTVLAKGQEYFQNQQFDKALNGDGGAFRGFKAVAEDYSSTDAGNLASLYAGLCSANLNKWKDAVEYLEDFSAGKDMMISPMAKAALGNAYAHLGELDKAVGCLKDAADMADSKAEDGVNNSVSPSCLIQAAEILESQGKKSDALEIYQNIKKKYVNAPVSQEIDKYIERCTE